MNLLISRYALYGSLIQMLGMGYRSISHLLKF